MAFLIAPIQVVIIPIIFKGKEKKVLEACKLLYKQLEDENIRSHLDDRDINPGNKYYDWEMKGIPLRIEIGPRDIDKKELIKAIVNVRDMEKDKQLLKEKELQSKRIM